jgi:hypothetical protein
MLKIIKADIRDNASMIREYIDGEISFGVLAENLAESMLEIVEEYNMIPPAKSLEQLNGILAEYRASDGCVMTWREEDGYTVDTSSLWDKE